MLSLPYCAIKVFFLLFKLLTPSSVKILLVTFVIWSIINTVALLDTFKSEIFESVKSKVYKSLKSVGMIINVFLWRNSSPDSFRLFIIKVLTEISVSLNISGLTLTKYYITYGRSKLFNWPKWLAVPLSKYKFVRKNFWWHIYELEKGLKIVSCIRK